jgi:hypothetical protein
MDILVWFTVLLVVSGEGRGPVPTPTAAPTDASLEVASSTFQAGYKHFTEGRIEQAIPHYEHAAATLVAMLGEKHAISKAMIDRLSVVRSSTPGHWLECGSPAERSNCGGSSVAIDTSLHEVRCCADKKLSKNWINLQRQIGVDEVENCAMWTETFSNFRIQEICQTGLDFVGAKNMCESQGARLCSRKEIFSGCTRGSGCGNDRHLFWTSSPGPVKNGAPTRQPTHAPTDGGTLATHLTTSSSSNGFDKNNQITRWMMSAQYHGRAENWDDHTPASCGFSDPELVAHSRIDADKFVSSDLMLLDMDHFLDPATGWRQYHFNKAEGNDLGELLSGCGGECNEGKGVDIGTHFNCQGLMAEPGATSCCSTSYAEHKFAYAVTYIWSDTAHVTTFHAGSDDGIVVWMNGKALQWGDSANDMGCHCYDDSKYAAPITFSHGWNRLMVKISQRSGTWGFRSRIDSTQGLRVFSDTVYPFNAASLSHDELLR